MLSYICAVVQTWLSQPGCRIWIVYLSFIHSPVPETDTGGNLIRRRLAYHRKPSHDKLELWVVFFIIRCCTVY